MNDLISRKDAKERLTILVNEIEGIFADIRERNVDDSVCGLCEYDCDHGIDGSAFECLGFERDDCFKLKDEYREEWTDVKDLPPAQPEPKRGRWIDVKDPYGFFDTIPVCSECGHTTTMRETYNYCPWCGARMEGEE